MKTFVLISKVNSFIDKSLSLFNLQMNLKMKRLGHCKIMIEIKSGTYKNDLKIITLYYYVERSTGILWFGITFLF